NVKEKNPAGQDVEIGRIGVGIVTKVVHYETYNPVLAVGYGTVRTWEMTVLTAKGLWKLVTLELPLSNLGGPIQIAAEGERQRREGLPSLALFTAVISVNLAVLNLLPVPMLDGGHLLFFVIEGVLGRPVSLKKREAAENLGDHKRHGRHPQVTDIHLYYKRAHTALEQGVEGIRLTPGNIGGKRSVKEVVNVANETRIPIRIGVNGGPLEKDLLAKYGG